MAAAGAEPEASGSSGAARRSADSYIGSFISLTSKLDIRYEGVLFNINIEESSIGLKNARSFGTEGRKKDGPQIPPCEKVYEYIVFRGGDIKDLQVRASPLVHSTPTVHNDPPVIQSHHSWQASLSTSMSSVGSGTAAGHSFHKPQLGLPRPAFQGGLPLYQPGGSLVSWGSPPAHPNAGLPMPLCWQGFYGPSSGLPHVQQPPWIQQPSILPTPHFMPQQMQYPAMNVSLPSEAQNLSIVPSLLPPVSTNSIPSLTSLPPIQDAVLPSDMSSNLMRNKVPPSLSPFSTGSGSNQSLTSTTLSPSLPRIQTASLPSEMSSSLMPNKVPVSSLPMTAQSANLSFMLPPLTSSLDASASAPLLSSKPLTVPAPILPNVPKLQSVSTIGGLFTSSLPETLVTSLVTPDQLVQPGPAADSFVQPLQAGKHVNVLQPASTEPSQSVPGPTPVEVQGPILPLPTQLTQRMNRAALQKHHSYRGNGRGKGSRESGRGRGNGVSERGRGNRVSERGRGNGVSERGRGSRGSERGRRTRITHSTSEFTEEFDFVAMNEKFNKDEVWGELDRSMIQLRAIEGIANDRDSGDTVEEDDDMSGNFEVKPRCAMDSFFDSLSPNAFDRGSRNGRMRHSDQMKIDIETFGDLARNHGRGGRGPGRSGRSRGSYYGGRGYGIGRRG